ncbi:MAG: mechanosensitive ion channel family protein [Burkholderiales bacterium]
MPPAWFSEWSERYPEWFALGGVLLAVLAGLLLHAVGHIILRRVTQHMPVAQRLLHRARGPARWLLPLLLAQAVLSDVEPRWPRTERWLGIAAILVVTVLVIRLIQAFGDVIQARYPVDGIDNLRARSVRTQTRVLLRTAMFLVGLLGVASVLMSFPSVRQLGTSLLASAGVAGIAAGVPARPVLGNLIAGMQIALTQPIRLDDVLIVENEWGRVEEITATYVVLRIWDDRRLVVPLQYFIEQPFQNWTRRTADLIGSVFFWVDYGMPIAPLRDELKRICEAAPEWDKRVCVLQVTDTTDRAVQLRALVSTPDAGTGWDLRCRVREELLAHMQAHYPHFLTRTRNQLIKAPESEQGRGAPEPPQPAQLGERSAVAAGQATP